MAETLKKYCLNFKSQAVLKNCFHADFQGKKAVISGSGNVATLACEKALIQNHCLGVFEGPNVSTTPEAVTLLMSRRLVCAPGKASNAGSVSVSGFEILQKKAREHWSKEKVDGLLKKTMEDIYSSSIACATRPKEKEDLVTLSNLNGFLRLVKAFKKQEGK